MGASRPFLRSLAENTIRRWRTTLADALAANPYTYRAAAAFDVLRGASRQPNGRHARSFKGSTTSHLQQHWTTTNAGANTLVGSHGSKLRARSRDLIRNNAHAASAVGKLVTRLVGCGIIPRPQTGDDALDARLLDLWERWAKQASVADDLTVYGLQAQAVRALVESGEVLIRRRARRPGDVSAGRALAVPLQLQILEADHLDPYKTEALATGGRIVQGVEFDAIGRRTAYWLYPEHPGESLVSSGTAAPWTSQRITGDGIAHLYQSLRPGQTRGIPWLAPVMITLRDLDEAQDTELVRMRMASALVAFVGLDETGTGTMLGAPEEGVDGTSGPVNDVNGNPLERVEPGMIAVLRGSKTVTMNSPSAIGGFPEYIASQLQRIAAGLGIPYEILAADLSRVNYSSYRAGNLEFRAMIETIQEHLIIPLLCEPLWRWFVDAAVAAYLIPDREYPVAWAAPRYEDIDRVKEATADTLEVRGGFTPRSEIVARRGYDPTRVAKQIAADNAQADELGLVLDSDPRKVNSSGAGQSGAAVEGPETARALQRAALHAAAEGDLDTAESLSRAAVVLALPSPA